ncbi:unnamed protein product, partial [Mesorhabditis belari]|uniref:IRG-type G domain-containing protein n=1 Tax=Mesorhabditis belari TaxID=2138241 RepID=A0AAF3FK32_9BILA
MEKITLAAPTSFSIPKKKRKDGETPPPVRAPVPEPESRPIWQNVHPNNPQFAKLHEILHTNCFDPNVRLAIHGANLLNNPWLNYRYSNYRKRLKASGQPDKEDIAFLQISKSIGELAHIAEYGVHVGTSLNDHLGDSENGVYLSTNVDLLGPQSFLISTKMGIPRSYVIRVVICKILKGKVNMVEPDSKNLKPTFGYGCHMAKPTGNDENKQDCLEIYRQQLMYVYEINEQVGEIVPFGVNVFGIKELETELAPAGILPYACVDVAVDFTVLTNKKLRIPRFELANSPFYTGRIFIMDEMYAVNLIAIKDESWKPLGIAPTLVVKDFVRWKKALEKSPLLDLSQNEFGAMIYNREIHLPNGLFVTYAVLSPLAISPQFTTLIETLTTNQVIGFCASTENVQIYLIPPGELANHLGLPSHIESAFHLIVAQPRSFFGLHRETLDQRMLARRRPFPDEILQGFHYQLKDYIDEEFRQNINSPSGMNAHYRLERSLSRNTQENSQNMRIEDQNVSMMDISDERTEFDGPDESELRAEDAPMVSKERSLMSETDASEGERLDKRERETDGKSGKDDRTQRLNRREQLDERDRETQKDVSMSISVDAEGLGDRVASMDPRKHSSQRAMNATHFIGDRDDSSQDRDRLIDREREMREKDQPTCSRDRSSERNVSTRRKDDWIERSNDRERDRHDKGRRDDSRERLNGKERGKKHKKERKRRRTSRESERLSSGRSASATRGNGRIDRSKERDRETRTDAPIRDQGDVEYFSDRSSTNARGHLWDMKECKSEKDERAKRMDECAIYFMSAQNLPSSYKSYERVETIFGTIPRRTRTVRFSTHEYAENWERKERIPSKTINHQIPRVIAVRPCMGNKTSRGAKLSDHIAFNTDETKNGNREIPNIVITTPTPIDENRSFLSITRQPPNSPARGSPVFQRNSSNNSSGYRKVHKNETPIFGGGSPPPIHPPPPPPEDRQFTVKHILERLQGPILAPKAAPRNLPVITHKPIFYSKEKVNKFEALNTTDRRKDEPEPIKSTQKSSRDSLGSLRSEYSTSTKHSQDSYPIYNPIEDHTFSSGKTFAKGSYPIDTNRINIGFCGRQGAGKSTLINALRGLKTGEVKSAGRYVCDNMEPFRFIEDELQNIVLWEIPYPRSFTAVVDIYDRNLGFDRFYDSHKLNVFNHLFVLIPDGSMHDDDTAFARVVHSRRTPLTILSTKSDDDIDAESRETSQPIGHTLLKFYEQKARRVFEQSLTKKAQILLSIKLLFISAPVVRNLVSSTIGYLHYEMNEGELLELIGLENGCHFEMEKKLRGERSERATPIFQARPGRLNLENGTPSITSQSHPIVQKSTVLADAGFEILFGTDDRVFGGLEPKTTVVRAGKTSFNYGFIGGSRVGKSTMINAMRGMSAKNPFAAGKDRAKPATCERFEFDDELLKYSVTLWELHYPKKVNAFFEFIDRHNFANFTALFIIIDTTPNDADLTFAKIAHRRNATVVFLSSKTDKKLSTKSRADEIPVCDILKQRYVDKGMERFETALTSSAPELCGRVQCFFVSSPVFRSLRNADRKYLHFLVHERAVFDFLKQKRIIAEMLDSPNEMKEGLQIANGNDTAGMIEVVNEGNDLYEDARN